MYTAIPPTNKSIQQTNKQQTCSIIPGNQNVLVIKPWGVEKGEGSKLKVRDGCWHPLDNAQGSLIIDWKCE